MKVRALPTWRNPVGEGAKRTLGLLDGVVDRLPIEDEFMDSDISGKNGGGLNFDGTGRQKASSSRGAITILRATL
jgi:hypothetical protein